MADIIRLRDGAHEFTLRMLPWYVNGTLDADEAAAVERHLDICSECRAELGDERALARGVAGLPVDVEQGWAALDSKLAAVPARRTRTALPFLRRRVSIGWMVAAPAVAAAAILAVAVSLPGAPVNQIYHALGSAESARPGNVLIMFAPDTRESDMRALLIQTGAHVVDGPNASGAYVLRAADGRHAETLKTLRNSSRIILAEPIGTGS